MNFWHAFVSQCWNQYIAQAKGIDQILALDGLSLFSDRDLSTAGGYDNEIRILSCILMLE